MSKWAGWLDERTGYRQILRYLLEENVPGGSRWRYVWGSTLVFTLSVQVVTGVFLWMAYSPSAQTAWASVYYVQHQMHGGWLLRGLHHFCAQAMILLLGAHLLQVVWDGAYRAPREVNFWFGLIMLHLVLALSLTGYLLPWDQKGYWATRVATNILGTAPLLGRSLQRLVMGGPEYGHHTLTRFFALHAGVLPGLVMLLLTGHLYLFRRHGLTAKLPKRRPDQQFWPEQVLKDAVACLIVLLTLLALIVRRTWLDSGASLGAELGAPADPTEPFDAARPEWYFLFMFQFLKLFPGGTEVWGAIIIPNLVLLFLFLMPLIARWKWGHRLNLLSLGSLMAGVVVLTCLALQEDRRSPSYQAAVKAADRESQRAVVLAESPSGIPSAGALALLRADPFTQGPKLFARNCASCHRYGGEDGLGKTPATPPVASDLKDFGSRPWLTGFLDAQGIVNPHYFGGTQFKNGKMARFLQTKVAQFSEEQKAGLTNAILALSAEAHLRSQLAADRQNEARIRDGIDQIQNKLGCTDCHQFHKEDADATAPKLTGYASKPWLVGMISNPAHRQYYGERNDRMPAFADQHILDAQAISLLADWLRGEWYEPPMTQAPQK